jgi:hypothetical protein
MTAAGSLRSSRSQPQNRLFRYGIGLFLACVCTWLGCLFGHEYLLGAQMQSANNKTEAEIHRYHIRRQETEQDIRALGTPMGIERAARKLGWTKRGEYRLHIPDN